VTGFAPSAPIPLSAFQANQSQRSVIPESFAATLGIGAQLAPSVSLPYTGVELSHWLTIFVIFDSLSFITQKRSAVKGGNGRGRSQIWATSAAPLPRPMRWRAHSLDQTVPIYCDTQRRTFRPGAAVPGSWRRRRRLAQSGTTDTLANRFAM